MHENRTTGSRKKGRPSEDEREARKTVILDAAVQLFIQNGFGQTTLDQVASSAQVTKRTIYSYFGDKSVVFAAVIERFRLDTVAGNHSSVGTLQDVCAKIVHGLHSDHAVGLHRLMIAEAAHFPALAASFYASGPRGYMEIIAANLPEPIAPAERPMISTAVFGLLLGEQHRKRLLGLTPAPDMDGSLKHASETLRTLGLSAA